MITYEAGEALRFEPYAINAGVQGVKQVMTHLEMLIQDVPKSKLNLLLPDQRAGFEQNLMAFLRSFVALGERVSKMVRSSQPYVVQQVKKKFKFAHLRVGSSLGSRPCHW